MKHFRIFTILFVVVLTLLSSSMIISAAGRKAYGDIYYGCTNHINPIKDKAWSTITYNGDTPVDNWLYVSMRVQFDSDGAYYWESPRTDSGYNRSEAKVEHWRYSIMAIQTTFEAVSAGCDDFATIVTASTQN